MPPRSTNTSKIGSAVELVDLAVEETTPTGTGSLSTMALKSITQDGFHVPFAYQR